MKKIVFSILTIVIFQFPDYAFSQTQSDNLMKYWFYRNRLQYFVVPGDGPGQSQVATIRNKYLDPPIYSTVLDYGQSCLEALGPYLGVLATEFYLLNKNGQYDDATNTLNELYLALNAIKTYWDEQAEPEEILNNQKILV